MRAKRSLISKSFLGSIGIAIVVLWLLGFWYLRNPAFQFGSVLPDSVRVNVEQLKKDTFALAGIRPTRFYKNVESVLIAEKYVMDRLSELGYKYTVQKVDSRDDQTFHNIIFRYESSSSQDVAIVGAHLDACGPDNPGADDNASGVAAILELARMLKEQKPDLDATIEFVIYALEEPPFFASKDMGSAYHADSLKERGANVRFAISLEMLGYYSDDLFSQSFPAPFLYSLYPWAGNFIAIVGLPADRELVRDLKKEMNANSKVAAFSINAPAFVPGIDFSDHRNYWEYEWPAVMITDTAFYRNKEYHSVGDTPERLDYDKMGEVVRGIYAALVGILK